MNGDKGIKRKSSDSGELSSSTAVGKLRGVGPKRALQLETAGVTTLGHLLALFPRDYEDLRLNVSLEQLKSSTEEAMTTVVGSLSGLRTVRTSKRNLTLVQGMVHDSSGSMKVVWFNRPFLKRQVKEGSSYRLHGKYRPNRSGGELLNPALELETGDLVQSLRPIYPRLGELGPSALRGLIDKALEDSDLDRFEDPVPQELLDRHQLPGLASAIATLHSPPNDFDLVSFHQRTTPAQSRLIYHELLALQMSLRKRERGRVRNLKKHVVVIDDSMRQAAREILPFPLTGAQKRVVREIAEDLKRPHPMQRLLQGDVGCGKTIVAALSISLALENGFQAAFMAPTEILAEQHMASLTALLGSRYSMALVTGTTTSDRDLRRDLRSGHIQLAIGTHALIQQDIEFDRLALAIVDEQHRFGVNQRQGFASKGEGVDLLVMTATPIPRSLALTAYGDLDLSVIDELPPGRQPIKTQVLGNDERESAYADVRAILEAGGRGYVVFPLIDENTDISASSLAGRGEQLRRQFSDFGVGVVHGRMSSDERMRQIEEFKQGRCQLLLSTTVIEVGVDIPEASVMVIEGAERFGLAQLHQLRGRVGRGASSSKCFALHGKLTDPGERRLQVFAESNDGFRIAEEDLDIRGPGELLGKRQAGTRGFGLANPVRDWRWLELAKQDATGLSESLAGDDFDLLCGKLNRDFAE